MCRLFLLLSTHGADVQPVRGGPFRTALQGARPEPFHTSGLGAQFILLQGS